MRVLVVLLLCAVASCQAYHTGGIDPELLSKVRELLLGPEGHSSVSAARKDLLHSDSYKRTAPTESEDPIVVSTVDKPNVEDPNAIPPVKTVEYVPSGRTHIDVILPETKFNYTTSGTNVESPYLGPCVEEVWSYDMDRLFTFPGSKFMVDMIERNFSYPGPLRPEMMQGFPAEGPVYLPWFLQSMEPQWMSAMMAFSGDWTGLPELFTRKVTMFAMEARMTCPSAFFDRFIARWSWSEARALITKEDGSMSRFFEDKFPTFFPTMEPGEVKLLAEEAAGMVHSWLVDEMVQHMYGAGFQDVARFSHIVYEYMRDHFERLSYKPWQPILIRDIVMPAWYHAGVRCETGQEVMRRQAQVVSIFKQRYEHYTETYVVGQVESFLARKAFELGREFHEENFPEAAVRECAARIRTYMDELLSWHDDQLARLIVPPTEPKIDFNALFDFFREMQVPGEMGFVTKMFNELRIPFSAMSGAPLVAR